MIEELAGSVPVQILVWTDAFEASVINHSANCLFGVAEALIGTILISHGKRQIDFDSRSDGERLSRVASRSPGEIARTLIGHLVRMVGVARVAAGVFFGMANLT